LKQKAPASAGALAFDRRELLQAAEPVVHALADLIAWQSRTAPAACLQVGRGGPRSC
jgi:hypothetical protein